MKKFLYRECLTQNNYHSPNRWDSTYARVFVVDTNGYLNNWNVNNTTPGLRPISFYNSNTELRQSIAELGYKIFP